MSLDAGSVRRYPALPRPDWKSQPRTIYFVIDRDEIEIGSKGPVRVWGGAPKPEPVVRKPRGYDLVSARREAPGPWGVGGRDDAEIQLLDANG